MGERRRTAGMLCALLAVALVGCDGSGGSSGSDPSPPPLLVEGAKYVDPNGRDSWSGSETQPWRTLAHALPALVPGQVLYVRGGEYREQLAKVNIQLGTESEPITVRAYPGERPVVRGYFWLRQPSYWTIDGVNVTADEELTPAPSALVKLTGGEGWTWENSEVWGSRSATNVLIAGYEQGEPSNWRFRQNCVHGVRPPPGSTRSSNLTVGDMNLSAGPGLISRNLFFSVPDGQNMVLGSGTGGPSRVQIRFNTLNDSKFGAIIVGRSRRVRFARNIVAAATSGLLVRGSNPNDDPNLGDLHNRISQNLGVGKVLLRPNVRDLVAGPGNLLIDSLSFSDAGDCTGFETTDPQALPYGRYGVG